MKYLIPTIDVEALRSLTKLGDFDKLILGEINGAYYGVDKIIELLNQFNCRGTFYVDFAEHGHGIEKFRKLSKSILESGNDLQLHIHPQFCSDNNRFLMNQYSYSEQNDIFLKCIDLYKKSSGLAPTSFRAGGYGANNDTLKAMLNNNIIYDSSYFYNHKWCDISPIPNNKFSKIGDIYELPITLFDNVIDYTFAGVKLFKRNLVKKLDVDSCSIDELKKGIEAFNNNGIEIVILFLHSYSFINRNYDYSEFSPNFQNIERFKFVLNEGLKHGYKITSLQKIYSKINDHLGDASIIPQISTKRNILTSLIKTTKSLVKQKLRGK